MSKPTVAARCTSNLAACRGFACAVPGAAISMTAITKPILGHQRSKGPHPSLIELEHIHKAGVRDRRPPLASPNYEGESRVSCRRTRRGRTGATIARRRKATDEREPGGDHRTQPQADAIR